MVSGASQTVTNFAKNAYATFVRRSTTGDPFNGQEDSLFVGHLMTQTNEFTENGSLDSERKRPAATAADMSNFVQRLKVRDS